MWGRRPGGGKPGRLPERGEKELCSWASFSRKRFSLGISWPRIQSIPHFLKCPPALEWLWQLVKNVDLSTPRPDTQQNRTSKIGGGDGC